MRPIPEATLRDTYTREQPYRRDWPKDFHEGMKNAAIRAICETLSRHQTSSLYRRCARQNCGMSTSRLQFSGENQVNGDANTKRTGISNVARPSSTPILDRKQLASGERAIDYEDSNRGGL